MSELPSNRESIKTPEKTADQLYEELNQAFDATMELMRRVHELEMKAFDKGLSEEARDAIIAERDQLAIERDQAWEAERKLEEKWRKKDEAEMTELEMEYKNPGK